MAINKRKQQQMAAKVSINPKPYETIFKELKAGQPAREALPPRAPGCTSYLQAYATQVRAVSSVHNYKGCSSACQGKPHPAGWFCEFCIKQPIQGETYSSESHWKHLQECSMMCLGNAARTKEERAAARQLFVCAISYLDGYSLAPSRRAEKGKKSVATLVKKPKLIPVSAKGKPIRKVQKPTLVRYPVNNQSRTQESSRVSSQIQTNAQTSASTSGTAQLHFAPTPYPSIISNDAATHDNRANAQTGSLARPPLQPPAPAPPTPNPSRSPSLSSLIRQPTNVQATNSEEASAAQPFAEATSGPAYIDLTGDETVDIKPDQSAVGDSQRHIPNLPQYLGRYRRFLKLGGLTDGRHLLSLKASQIEKYVEKLHSRSAGTEHEMDALTQLNMESDIERFLAAGE